MDKVAIVCGSPSSEMDAPFNDPTYQIWVLGNRLNRYPRADLVFEIHNDNSHHDAKYEAWLASQEIPMIVGDGFPIAGDHIGRFPFEAVRDIFGSTYLTSTTAYMIAYALLHDVKRLELYGVDMAVDDHEYFWQRPCLEAWIGFAKGRGVDVWISPKSPVLRSDYIEGIGKGGRPDFSKPPFTQKGFLELAAKHSQNIDDLDAQIKELAKRITAHDAARQVYERLAKVARAVEAGQDIENLADTVSMR